MVWRGAGGLAEPWPGRHDAFLTACAQHAGHREKDLIEIVEGIAGAAEEAAAQPQVVNPARR